jgi:hypothetical protein
MPQTREFPYKDGDITVLGPEIFASKGGAVICWRGENYIRQQDAEAPRDLTADAVYELASSVRDLTSAIRLETADRHQVEEADPHNNIRLCVGPLDADEIGTEVADMLRKIRRQAPGGDV